MRVVVAMSGGVDSSAVAGLLHEAGHEVIGVTLQLYDHGAATGRKGACCAGQDIHDARRVADRLGIPHYVIDAEAAVRRRGDRRFRRQLRGGRDAGALRALQPDGEVRRPDGAGARPGRGAAGDRALCAPRSTGRTGRNCTAPPIRRATRAGSCSPPRARSLAFCAVPAGRDAGQARRCAREAARLGLPVAAKPDSQDICFVPSGSYADVVGAAAARCRGAGRDRRPRRARARPARRHRALHGRPGQAARRCGDGRRRAAGGGGAGPGAPAGGGRAARCRHATRCGCAR